MRTKYLFVFFVLFYQMPRNEGVLSVRKLIAVLVGEKTKAEHSVVPHDTYFSRSLSHCLQLCLSKNCQSFNLHLSANACAVYQRPVCGENGYELIEGSEQQNHYEVHEATSQHPASGWLKRCFPRSIDSESSTTVPVTTTLQSQDETTTTRQMTTTSVDPVTTTSVNPLTTISVDPETTTNSGALTTTTEEPPSTTSAQPTTEASTASDSSTALSTTTSQASTSTELVTTTTQALTTTQPVTTSTTPTSTTTAATTTKCGEDGCPCGFFEVATTFCMMPLKEMEHSEVGAICETYNVTGVMFDSPTTASNVIADLVKTKKNFTFFIAAEWKSSSENYYFPSNGKSNLYSWNDAWPGSKPPLEAEKCIVMGPPDFRWIQQDCNKKTVGMCMTVKKMGPDTSGGAHG